MRLVIAAVVSLLLFGCTFGPGSNEELGSTLAQTPQESDVEKQLTDEGTPPIVSTDTTTDAKASVLCATSDCRSDDTKYYGSKTCRDFGFYEGEPSCSDCKIDTSTCGKRCGDGQVHEQYGEQCDWTSFGNVFLPGKNTCQALGYHGGQLRCNRDTCQLDLSDCVVQGYCGDKLIQANYGEFCERDQSMPCKDLAASQHPKEAPYVTGTATCQNTCTWDKNACRQCAGDAGLGQQCSFGQTQDCSLFAGEDYKQGTTATCDATTCQWVKGSCSQCTASGSEECAVGQTQNCTLFAGEDYKQGTTATCDTTTCQWEKSTCTQCVGNTSLGEQCSFGQTQDCSLFVGENYKQGTTATCDATTCQWVKGSCSQCTASGSEECAVGQTQDCTALNQLDGKSYYAGQTSSCLSSTCKWDRAVCAYCGDGTVHPTHGEECEGSGAKPCTELSLGDGVNYYGGTAVCNACKWDRSACTYCGDQIVQTNEGEMCDFGHSLSNGTGRVLQIATSNLLTCVLRQMADGGIVTCRGNTSLLNLQELANKSFRKIAVASRSLCGVESLDGAIFCQGDSWAVTNPDKPTGNGYVDTAGGIYHMCAVDAGNKLACWGQTCDPSQGPCWSDNMGNLEALSVNAVAVGGDNTCYLKTDGTISCFGANSGQVVSAAPTGQYKKLSVGSSAACGILQEAWMILPQVSLQAGDLVCWGANSTTVNDPAQPVLNVGTLSGGPYEDLVVNNGFGCAKKQVDGATQWECWGNTDDLANALLSDSANVTHTTLSPFYSDGVGCITKMNGTVLCMAQWYHGHFPKNFVLGGASSVQRIVMAPYVTFLLSPQRAMTPIGEGDPIPGEENMPTTDVLDVSGSAEIYCRGFCAVAAGPTTDVGQLVCWGDSNSAAILDNNVPTENDFVQVIVGADYDHENRRWLPFACGLRDGDEQNGYKVKCWGENHASVTAAPGSGETGYTRLATSSRKGICARKIDGSMLCWGDNAGSHLSVPALLNAGDKFTNQMGGSAGGSGAQHFFCFIANDTGELSSTKGGYIVCSGDDAPTPPAGTDFIQLAVDGKSLCALRLGGEVECVTQFGLSPDFSPHPLWGLQIDQFAIAKESLCGLQRNTGLVLCAGKNYYDQAPLWPLSNQDPTALPATQCPPNVTCRVCNLSCQLQNVP